jgi:uncharacterized protein
MTVRLRPHHLLCLLTYAGKGYSSAFVANYDLISKRLSGGEDILVVDEPDDICAPLLNDDEPHCWRKSVRDRDKQAAQDIGRLLNLSVSEGSRLMLEPALIERMRARFAHGETRSACTGCEWFELCSTIAADTYRDTRILPPEA